MKHGAALVAVVVVGIGVTSGLDAQDRRAPASATIARVAWLAGSWSGGDDGATTEEHWTPPAGGAMLAVSRSVYADRTTPARMTAFEFLRIVERDGTLVYIAQPNGRPPTEFVLTAITGESATFENPAHDSPQAIRYTRRPDGSLQVRLEGGRNSEAVVFRRVPTPSN